MDHGIAFGLASFQSDSTHLLMFLPLRGPNSINVFFKEYWQKRPFFQKNALRDFRNSILQREVFNLAKSPDYNPRVIQHIVESDDWEVFDGPFMRRELQTIFEENPWTLLLNDTERVMDSVHHLLENFRCFPNWRLDDVQLSYAVPDGSVGPHVDSYDVFLVQIKGKRRWKIEQNPATDRRPTRDDVLISLLKDFNPDLEFIASPGDLLYLPAKTPHWGIAMNKCITASIGFKAPDIHLLTSAISQISEDTDRVPEPYRYGSGEVTLDPGYVGSHLVDWFQNEIQRLAKDQEYLERTLCKSLTLPIRDHWPTLDFIPPSPSEVREGIEDGAILLRLTPSCLVYYEFEDCIRIYSLGFEYKLRSKLKPFAQLLTGSQTLNWDSMSPYLDDKEILSLLAKMVELGSLIGSEPS